MAGWDDLGATRFVARGEEMDKARGFGLDTDQYVTGPIGALGSRTIGLLESRTRPAGG